MAKTKPTPLSEFAKGAALPNPELEPSGYR
jgi:hypothetical protein